MPEEKDFTLSPRIEELQDKLAKDPKSRIFLQLAEEYRKSGMAEEAIAICQEGLKHHPGYVSAKVTLGKAYLDLKKIDEAQQIFEDVIEQSPDNLMANRSLGDIYYMKGYAKDALKHYKVINMFNPSDQMMAEKIKELTAQLAEPQAIAVGEEGGDEGEAEEIKIEPTAWEEEKPEPSEVVLEQELETKEELPAIEQKEEAVAPEPAEPLEEITLKEEVSPEEEVPQVEIDLTAIDETEEGKTPEVEIDLTAEEGEEIALEEKKAEEEKPVQPKDEQMLKKKSVLEVKAEEVFQVFAEEEIEAKEEAAITEEEEIASPTLAEIYLKQGLIDKAIGTYQQILKAEPDNLEIKIRLEQLISKKKAKEELPAEQILGQEGEEPSAAKEAIPSLPLDEKKSDKLDTLNKWLENIRKLK